MLHLNVFIEVKKNDREKFLTNLKTMLDEARKEEGNIYYELYLNSEDENKFVTVEYWEDDFAFSQHKETSFFKEFCDSSLGYLVKPMEFIRYYK